MTSRLPLGKLPPELLERILKQAPSFDERLFLGPGTGLDCAVLDYGDRYLVLTTDSHVIHPLFFPGGDVGELAVNGTVNDLAVAGATPLWLSAGFVVEEGFAVADLRRIARSMARAAVPRLMLTPSRPSSSRCPHWRSTCATSWRNWTSTRCSPSRRGGGQRRGTR